MSGSCKSCRSKALLRDDVSGCLICSSCGIVQDFYTYEAQIGGLNGPQGTFVHVGTSGMGSSLDYKEKKIFEAQKLIDDIVSRLDLSASDSDIRTMISEITEGEFGQGDWFRILIGACVYVTMRKYKDNRSIPISEVASEIGCDVHELGRMVMRVVDFLDLKKPEFPDLDIVWLLERALKKSPCFARVEKDKLDGMLKQGVFLIQCAVKWFLTTGRRPLPVVVAVLVLVAEVNEVDVSMEDVAKEVHSKVSTTRRRYKELLEILVKVAQALPWGKDITVKNIVKNAHFVIQYMERKSMMKPGGEVKELENIEIDLGDVIKECLQKEVEYGVEVNDVEDESQYFEIENGREYAESKAGEIKKLKISHECLSLIYSEFLKEMAQVKSLGGTGGVHGRQRKRQYCLEACTDWWEGKSELSKKLLLEQLLGKDVGLNAVPPSFVSSCLTYDRRRAKIKAAKLRIHKIMHPSSKNTSSDGNLHVGNKRKRRLVNSIDWEDLIIETLLLHQVKEEEIEKGHYNTLLDLHVFNSGIVEAFHQDRHG